jgi:lipopolysaccharide/colanic/teichoic acid biosynthesis glycosyltransferase
MNATIARLRSATIRPVRVSAGAAPPRALAYRQTWRSAIFVSDAMSLTVAFGASLLIAWRAFAERPSFGAMVVAMLILIVGYAAHDLHERTCAIVCRDEFYYGAATTIVLGFPVAVLCSVIGTSLSSRVAVIGGILFAACTVGTARYLLRRVVGEERIFEPDSSTIACDRCSRFHITRSRVRWAKRFADVCVALLVTPPALLLVALAAAAVRIESSGPVFYRQRRVGRNGQPFDIVKLRTMHVDAEAHSGPVWAVQGDTRVTRVGRILRRLSIDELPQLFNVLRGEMSIVGPRPERPAFVDRFSKEYPNFAERLAVAPGLTSCSHLYMSRTVDVGSIERRLDYDLFYIRHWSLAMDLALVLKTAAEVPFHRAA